MAYALKRHDRATVLEALRSGEYEAITTSGQSVLDQLMHLAIELGVLTALRLIRVARERRGIPDELLLRLLAVLPFVEAMGVSEAAGELFKDASILLELGFSIREIQEGFNDRHHGGDEGTKDVTPCNPEVLRQELARLDADSLHDFQQECIGELYARKLVKGQVCAIDGTGLGKDYQLVGLMNVHKDRPLWLSWRVLDGDASEKGKDFQVVRSLVEDVIAAGGPDTIEWLLMDALYADGPLLAWLEYGCGIHALVRLPEDRQMYQDLEGLARTGLADWKRHTDARYLSGHKQVRDVSVAMASDLRSWHSFVDAAAGYGAKDATLWGALIHAVDRDDPSQVEDWGLASTCPFNAGWAGYRHWRQRWRIENCGFRELKQGWHLERAPWSRTNDTAVAARVTFTLIAFNVAQLAKTTQGRRLTDRGIRRLRREMSTDYGTVPVIVFTEDAYAIFHIEEIMALTGLVPKHSLRRRPSGRSGAT